MQILSPAIFKGRDSRQKKRQTWNRHQDCLVAFLVTIEHTIVKRLCKTTRKTIFFKRVISDRHRSAMIAWAQLTYCCAHNTAQGGIPDRPEVKAFLAHFFVEFDTVMKIGYRNEEISSYGFCYFIRRLYAYIDVSDQRSVQASFVHKRAMSIKKNHSSSNG